MSIRSGITSILFLLFQYCFSTPVDVPPRLMRRADAPNVPPTVPPNINDCHFQFFSQKIDHFGQHDGTFQQKYNLVADYFKPEGPILLFQGEESTYLDCVDTSILHSWAQELNGIAVSLEHRYFGQSNPLNATDPIKDNAKYKYLTLDNVMADAANFLAYVKNNITGAENSKVIVSSGSYGGFLATAFRQNRPEDFYGAIASAPPVAGLGNDTKSEAYYAWNTWLNGVYQDRSATASAKIKNAFQMLEQRFTSGNTSGLKHELSLCYEPDPDDLEIITAWLHVVFNHAAEFNYARLRPGRSSAVLPLEAVVNITLTQPDPIQILNETLWLWFGPGGGIDLPCINYRETGAINVNVPLIQQNTFQYLTCKYFPFNSLPDIPNGTIFPAANPGAVTVSACDQMYNISTPSASSLRTRYKFTDADLRNSTRIIWSLGQYDPTSAAAPNAPGINAPPLSIDRNVSRVLYVSEMAHREDLWAPDPSDRDTVIEARRIEVESIKGWLGWYDL